MPFARPTIIVETTPQSYRIPVNDAGCILQTGLYINRYCDAFVERTWNHVMRTMVPVRKYRYYSSKKQKLYLPRYDLVRFKQFANENGYDVIEKELPLSKGVEVSIPLKQGVKDRSELQTQAIQYLTDHPDKVKGLALQTGCLSGKSVVQLYDGTDTLVMMTIKELYQIFSDEKEMAFRGWDQTPPYILGYNDGQVTPNQVVAVMHSGPQLVSRAELANGMTIDLTGEHQIMTRHGWRMVCDAVGLEVQYVRIADGQHVLDWSVLDSLEETITEDVFDIECPPDAPAFICNGFVVHNSGKTYSALKTISLRGRRAIIMVAGMLEQWERAIYQFTDLTEDDIYVIKGEASIGKLMSQIDRKLKPKIIIGSIGTVRNYSQDKDAFENYPDFDDFCQHLGIGTRFTDEAHLNFYTNLIVDLRWACELTVVLTATFGRSQQDVKRIFDSHYPSTLRFGEGQYKKYVAITEYIYRTGNGDIPWKAFKTAQGYSQVALEKYLLKQKAKFHQIWDTVWLPALQGHYANIRVKGERCLVLCQTVAMCEYIQKLIQRKYPDDVVNIYISETEDEVLSESDWIISTPLSAGTGRDIPDLLTVLCGISVVSTERNLQILGRLRELKSGRTPQFVYTSNQSIYSQMEHSQVRRQLFETRALTFKQIRL